MAASVVAPITLDIAPSALPNFQVLMFWFPTGSRRPLIVSAEVFHAGDGPYSVFTGTNSFADRESLSHLLWIKLAEKKATP